MSKLTVEQNLKAAIIASVNHKPTKAALMSRSLLEAKKKINPSVVSKARKHDKPVFEAVERGSVSYVKETEGENTTLYVPALQDADQVVETLKKMSEEEVGQYVADNLIEVEKDTNDEFKSGDTVDTLLGTFTVVETEDSTVYLLDQNNEVISMSVEDLKELEPVESVAKTEATQAGDIAIPMETLEPKHKAIFKTKGEDGTIKEEQVTADNEKEFNDACAKIEQEPGFVEWVDFIGVENESDIFGEMLSDQDDVTDEVDTMLKDNANETRVIAGKKYRSDMGVFTVKKVKGGRVTINMDGKDIDIEIAELELVHPRLLS